MKKRILGVAIIAAVAVAAGWNFNQNKNEVDLSDLALAGMEALAKNETFCKRGQKDTGTCKTNLDVSTGKSCMHTEWHESKDCYGTGSENI